MADYGVLSPGLTRAAGLDDEAFAAAMVRAEAAWSHVLGDPAADDLLAVRLDIPAIAAEAESGGNPLIPLLAQLRSGYPGDIHRGLTSQDVIDTALMLLAKSARAEIVAYLDRVVTRLGTTIESVGSRPYLAYTLAQPARETTLSTVLAPWRTSIVAAIAAITGLQVPLSWGGPVGDGSTISVLGNPDELVPAWGRRLGLDVPEQPWHVDRTPVLRLGSALAQLCAASGKIAADVLLLVRRGLAAEPTAPGRGGSSSMPHKHNPVLSILLRRSALAAPGLLSTLYSCAGSAVDQRPDGAWHAEWEAFRALLRHGAASASLLFELIEGLTFTTEEESDG